MMQKLHPGHRVMRENEMIRKRDKEFQYEELWTGTREYFKHWEKVNSKFDKWTSPRYYDENNQMVNSLKSKHAKEERLLDRREKLRKLFDEESRSFSIELMVQKSKEEPSSQSRLSDIPTELLKNLNIGIKMEEEDRRNYDSEINLYHRWRTNNPAIRNNEERNRCKNMKMSWLDQQIEKRMQKEQEEETRRRSILEREERQKKELQRDREHHQKMEENKHHIRLQLDKQSKILEQKLKETERLKLEEETILEIKNNLQDLEKEFTDEQKRRSDRELLLVNIKQYRRKLKQQFEDNKTYIYIDEQLGNRIQKLKIDDIFKDKTKKVTIENDLLEFKSLLNIQKQLEAQRDFRSDFMFDSETKNIYLDQNELWHQEAISRKNLMKSILERIKTQVELNLLKNLDKQKNVTSDRENILESQEDLKRQLLNLETYKMSDGIDKTVIEDESKKKTTKKNFPQDGRLRQIENEIYQLRKEEDELKNEIVTVQRRQGPGRRMNSRFFIS